MAEAGDGAVDQARVDFSKHIVGEAKAIHHVRPEVLEQDVAVSCQIENDLSAVRRSCIGRDALLVAIDREVHMTHGRRAIREWRHRARRIALYRFFDLDDFCAQVAENHRAERTGQDARHVQHADAVQRAPSGSHGLRRRGHCFSKLLSSTTFFHRACSALM